MEIKLLHESLINKIAAGEVIERPASIVKELVENSIDAGSTRISISISGGGIERILVQDNGVGIPSSAVPLAMERHATSKISQEDDLAMIHTMGFRGEALPSIASISKMELITATQGKSGVRAIYQGGQLQEILTLPSQTGTRVVVEDIFFNTPVRKKFLKSSVSENLHVYNVSSKLALSHPEISFSLSSERKQYFKTPGNGNLLDTVTSIYGKDFASNFINLNWQGNKYSLEGLISQPEFRRSNRKNQIFFVNKRWVKNPLLSRAVDEAYRGLLLSREYPGVILFLTIVPEEIDVNVHPQKTEVRFREEKTVFRMLHRAIRDKLSKLTFSLGIDIVGKESASSNLYLESGKLYPDYSPTQAEYKGQLLDFDDSFYRNGTVLSKNEKKAEDTSTTIDMGGEKIYLIGQCFNSFILLEKGEELWLVDQHAAHERILYERLRKPDPETKMKAQLLAFPLALDLSSMRVNLLSQNQAFFQSLGLEIETIGPASVVIRSAPVLFKGKEIEMVNHLLDLLEDKHPIDFIDRAYALLACKNAVKAGESLIRLEMERIITELLCLPDFRYCPHGRPTILEVTHSDLDKRFKR